MDTFKQRHIDTIDEAIEVLHTSGYNHTSLKFRLEQIKAKMLESQKRELEKERLASIDRDAKRLEEIGQRLQRLGEQLFLLEPHEVEFRK